MVDEQIVEIARAALTAEAEGIVRSARTLGMHFCRIVRMIDRARCNGGKVVITGVGKNVSVGEKIAATMSSTGTACIFIHSVQALHGDIGIVSKADVVLALSCSGESEEVVKAVPCCHRMGASVIAVVGNVDSTLAKISDHVLPVDFGKEACPFGLAPTTSTTTTLALGDALAVVLMKIGDFSRADYALRHPEGAIGRALILKAADVMSKGKEIVVVSQSDVLPKILSSMLEARVRHAWVVDASARLCGIVRSDRLLEMLSGKDEFRVRKAFDIMDPCPRRALETTSAIDVRDLMEDNSIDVLPVTDKDGRPVGSIELSKIPKMKHLI